MNISELKSTAKNSLTGKWGIALLSLLIFAGLEVLSSFTFVLEIVILGPLSVGLAVVFTNIIKDEEPRIEQMFDGFKYSFVNSFIAYLLVALFTFLWSLLFIIPGIIKAIGYSMTKYIIRDNPQLDGMEAMKKSEELMRGHKMDYFVMCLSFIGWFILSALTFGLLLLYVYPYYMATEAAFYEKIKNEIK